MPSPALTYYRPLIGAWRGPFAFTPTAPTPRHATLLDCLRIRSLPLLRFSPGAVHFDTTVAVPGPSEILHTTRVHTLGLTLLWSEESILVADDGRSFTMQGRQRMAPTPWKLRSYTGAGRIHDDARGASYDFGWLGLTMHQEARAAGDVVTLDQTTPVSVGLQRLARVR